MDTSSIPAKGSDVPTLRHVDAHVRPLVADVWYCLGLQLLDSEDVPRLDAIKANNPNNASGACTEMFSLWLQKNPSASWSSLISTIRGPGVNKYDVAHHIERMLQTFTVTTSAVDLPTSPPDKNSQLFCQSMSIRPAYASLLSRLGSILKKDNLPLLKIAFIGSLTVPGIKVGEQLNEAIESAKTSDDLLHTLQRFSCCNWLDTDLLGALACGSSQPAAYELIKAYEKFLHPKKLDKVLSCFSKSKVQKPYAIRVGAKIGINPNKITVGVLLRHRGELEDVILNLGKGIVNIDHVQEGCLEIICSIPAHCSFVAYRNALHNRHKFYGICLLYLTCDIHPIVYDPWLFDLEEQTSKRTEIFNEHEVATQLSKILVENTPVDDIIAVFRSHDVLMGDNLKIVSNAPSDYLKKMFLLRLFQNVNLSVWSTICAIVNESEILEHLSDQLMKVLEQNMSVSAQSEEIATDSDTVEQPLVTEALCGTRTALMTTLDDSMMVNLPDSPLHRKVSSSFHQLNCLKHLKPSTVDRVFQYTVKHVIELLSCCDPNLLIKWCKHLKASDTHEIKLFTANFMDQMKQLKSSKAILKMLSHYWAWSSYSILKALAQFSKLALDMLEEFDARLNTMLSIAEYTITSLAVSMFPYDTSSYTVLTLECDHKLNQSLQLVYDMQSVITENCDITQHALLLLAVDSYPTRLYWMIPKSVVTIVNTRVMECSQLLVSKGVIKIFIYPSTVHVLDTAKTVWPYMFLNKSETEDAVKVLRPPTDQIQMLQHVRKQRDSWHVEAKKSKEAEEKFRRGYEKEEQKCKELNEEKTKEAHTVAKCKEKINLCKEDVELTIKTLTGDTEALPTVAGCTKQFLKVESVKQLEHDLTDLELFISHLLRKSLEQKEEWSKSSQQLEQQLVQKEKEIEDHISKNSAKDHKLDDFYKNRKKLIEMNSDLKLQQHNTLMRFEECNRQLSECQKHLKSKDEDLLATHKQNEETKHHLEELLAKEREEKEMQR